ncbi:(Fe-S)-binding protein [Haliangium sp.]|uniref:(Fe-S)-binding protein n=1 Tax=Haliangium sp. TaxID=2663208 RepID=UPI003D0D9513
MRTVIFVILLAAAGGFFIRTIARMAQAAARGVDDPRPRLDQLGERIRSVLVFFLGQKKVVTGRGPMQSPLMWSWHHLIIFWGFLVITIASAEILVNGLIPAVSLELLPAPIFLPLKLLIDVLNLAVLLIVGWSFFRRIVLKPRLIPMNMDAGLILGSIGCLMLTHFLYHGFHIVAAGGEAPAYAVVSGLVASGLQGTSHTAAVFGAEAAYWLHVLILLTFLNYLPYSKHIHLLGALPNILTRNLSERRLDMPKLDLEDENQWGVGRYEQFSWKSLLDTYACTECARCSNYCPAYTTEKNLSPMQLVHDIRYEMLDRHAVYTERDALKKQIEAFPNPEDDGHKHPDFEHLEAQLAEVEERIEAMPEMVGERIAEDTLWACTTCGACQEVCPVFIEHPLKILQMRQNLVLEQEKVPSELGRTFRNIERQSNPWGIAADQRMDWAADLNVPTIEDNPNPEYILWVGCAGAFDNRIIKQTKAMIQILEAAGVDYAVLGHNEGCTGDPARRAGNEMLFQMQAETNIEALNEAGAKKVITSCPHCLHTLRHDYPQFGGDYEVIHHTKLIAHLMESGRIRTNGGSNGIGSITYHDSCYLGRWNREFEAPRAILEGLSFDKGLIELGRNRQHGFCCGAGGGRMFMEEEEPRVNVNRTDEVIASGADAVAVACPFCNIMLTDGMKHRDKEEDIQVLDVAEVVASRLIPASSLVRKKSDAADGEA